MSHNDKGQLNPNATGFVPSAMPPLAPQQYAMQAPQPSASPSKHAQKSAHLQQQPVAANGAQMMYPYMVPGGGMPPGLPPNGQFPPGGYPQMPFYPEFYYQMPPQFAPPGTTDPNQTPGQPGVPQPPNGQAPPPGFVPQFPNQPMPFYPPFDPSFMPPPGMHGYPQFVGQPIPGAMMQPPQHAQGQFHAPINPILPDPAAALQPVTSIKAADPTETQPEPEGNNNTACDDDLSADDDGYYDDYLDDLMDDGYDFEPTVPAPSYSVDTMYSLNPTSAVVNTDHLGTTKAIISQVGKLADAVAVDMYGALYSSRPAFSTTLPFLIAHQNPTILNQNAVNFANNNPNIKSSLVLDSVLLQGTKSFRSRRLLHIGSTKPAAAATASSSTASTPGTSRPKRVDGEKATDASRNQTGRPAAESTNGASTNGTSTFTRKPRFALKDGTRPRRDENGADPYLRVDDSKSVGAEKRQFRPRDGLTRGNMGSLDHEEEEKKRERAAGGDDQRGGERARTTTSNTKDGDGSSSQTKSFSFGLSRDMMGSVEETDERGHNDDRERHQSYKPRDDDSGNGPRGRDNQQQRRTGAQQQAARPMGMRTGFGASSAPLDWEGQLKQNFQSLFNKLSISKFSDVSHDIAFQVMAYATLSTSAKFVQASELCAHLLYNHALLNTAFIHLYSTLASILSANLPPTIQDPNAPTPNPLPQHIFKAKIIKCMVEGFPIVTNTIVDAQSIQHPLNPNAPLLVYVAEHDDEQKIRQQEKFISWIQVFCEMHNQGLLPLSFLRDMLAKLRFVSEAEFDALVDLPEKSEKAKEYSNAVDLKRISYEALQAWNILLIHSGQQIERDYPQIGALMFRRSQWLSDYKPLTALFRFKLKDILDWRRDGWKNQPVSRPKLDAKLTPESIKMYEITDNITSQNGHQTHQNNILEKKRQAKTPAQTNSVLTKLDSAGQAAATTTASTNIFSRFFNKAAAPAATPATTTTTTTAATTQPEPTSSEPEDDRTSTDKWIPNASAITDQHLNINLIVDFCNLSSESWTPIHLALRSCLGDFQTSQDIGEINYALSNLMAKQEYLDLFTPYLPVSTQKQPVNSKPQPTPKTLAQAHLPVFFAASFILNCFKTRTSYGLAEIFSVIIYKYASLLQFDSAAKINTSISIEDITTKCRDMFVVNWQHVIIALFAGIMPNISDILEEYPKAREILPTMLAIWLGYIPMADYGITTQPTTLSYTFVQLFIPLITQAGPLKSHAQSMVNEFMAAAANVVQATESQKEPKAQPQQELLSAQQTTALASKLVANQSNPDAPIRQSFLAQTQSCIEFVTRSFTKGCRALFFSAGEFTHQSAKVELAKLPSTALQLGITQFLLLLSVSLWAPVGSPRYPQHLDAAQTQEYQQLANKLISSNFLTLAFVKDDGFVVKMYQALKASTSSTVPQEYQALYKLVCSAVQPNQVAAFTPANLLLAFLSKSLPPDGSPSVIKNNQKAVVNLLAIATQLYTDIAQ